MNEVPNRPYVMVELFGEGEAFSHPSRDPLSEGMI